MGREPPDEKTKIYPGRWGDEMCNGWYEVPILKRGRGEEERIRTPPLKPETKKRRGEGGAGSAPKSQLQKTKGSQCKTGENKFVRGTTHNAFWGGLQTGGEGRKKIQP